MRERSFASRARRFARRMVLVALAGVVLVVGGATMWAGTEGPTATLEGELTRAGAPTPFSVTLRAGRAGLSSWKVEVLGAGGSTARLSAREIPRAGLLGSGVRARTLDLEIDPAAAGLTEGPAELRVYATDHSPLAFLRSEEPILRRDVTIDLTPPQVAVLGGQHYVRVGGSDLVVYTVSADAVRSGVEIGDTFFSGSPAGLSGQNRAALYALPHDLPEGEEPRVVAYDLAGNSRRVGFPVQIRRRDIAMDEIRVSDGFLRRKIPPLLVEAGRPVPEDLVAGYLVVNRELRQESEERLDALFADSSETLLFKGALRQQRGTQVRSGFAEHRTYLYEGRVIDEQTHLGFDLASVKQAPIGASADGRVRFVGPLGIYGGVVLLDHGLGLATLYAHLSSTAVQEGDMVKKGQTLGRSGETGLAGGDHLHFSVMVGGTHVDPIEWWDPKWVENHVAGPLREAAPAGTT